MTASNPAAQTAQTAQTETARRSAVSAATSDVTLRALFWIASALDAVEVAAARWRWSR